MRFPIGVWVGTDPLQVRSTDLRRRLSTPHSVARPCGFGHDATGLGEAGGDGVTRRKHGPCQASLAAQHIRPPAGGPPTPPSTPCVRGGVLGHTHLSLLSEDQVCGFRTRSASRHTFQHSQDMLKSIVAPQPDLLSGLPHGASKAPPPDQILRRKFFCATGAKKFSSKNSALLRRAAPRSSFEEFCAPNRSAKFFLGGSSPIPPPGSRSLTGELRSPVPPPP